jgi:hypothetical protein
MYGIGDLEACPPWMAQSNGPLPMTLSDSIFFAFYRTQGHKNLPERTSSLRNTPKNKGVIPFLFVF